MSSYKSGQLAPEAGSLPPNQGSQIQLGATPQRSLAAASLPSHPSGYLLLGDSVQCASMNTSMCISLNTSPLAALRERPPVSQQTAWLLAGNRTWERATVPPYLLIEDVQGLPDVLNILLSGAGLL